MSPVRLTLLAAFVFGFLVGCGGTSQRGACNATTCMSGCCDGNGECQPGFLESACGTGGLACFSCAAGLSCQFGVCVPGSSQGGGAGGSSGGGTGGGLGGGSGGGLGGGSGGGLGGGSGGGVGGGSGGGIGGGIGGGLGGGSGGGVGGGSGGGIGGGLGGGSGGGVGGGSGGGLGGGIGGGSGGGLGGGSGGGGSCVPKTCGELGKDCGSVSNGCGATITCGSCTSPLTCGGGGVSNVCGSPAGRVVISQIYGAGGNAGATWTHDFVELFNPSSVTVNLSGWSLQYGSATGTTWQVTPLSGVLTPGRYLLVQQASGGGGTTPLPAPDVVGSVGLAASSGKIALVRSTTALPVACPMGGDVVDIVGYGSATCFEGSAPAPAPGTTLSINRIGGGCSNLHDNAGDFMQASPSPRNTSSTPQSCSGAP